jgi:hypothetical protein
VVGGERRPAALRDVEPRERLCRCDRPVPGDTLLQPLNHTTGVENLIHQ